MTDKEIEELFFNLDLHEKNSFFVIDKEKKGYDLDIKFETHIDRIRYLKEKYETGHTIVIKNMEHYNASIQEAAKELGEGTDVHLYLTPEGGDSFDWHTDDKTVWVKLVKGTKSFALRYRANETLMMTLHTLREGEYLYIGKGVPHKATPIGSSVLLSFGLPNLEDV